MPWIPISLILALLVIPAAFADLIAPTARVKAGSPTVTSRQREKKEGQPNIFSELTGWEGMS